MSHDTYPQDAEPASPRTWLEVALENEIISVLDSAPVAGERLEFAFRRKEAELASVFERLTVMDARELHRRLTLLLPDDPVAARFARLVAPRRGRLVAFLGDARRREALRAAK